MATPKPRKSKSQLEDDYLYLIRDLPQPKREQKFIKGRRFAFDFAWNDYKIAVEIEGGTWSGGRHTTGAGFAKDCEKYNLAVIEGWRVLRFTSNQVYSNYAYTLTKDMLHREGLL